MSFRRAATASPLIGWSSKASPSAVQCWSVPVSKSRFIGLPSAPRGRMPSAAGSAVRVIARRSVNIAQSLFGPLEQVGGVSLSDTTEPAATVAPLFSGRQLLNLDLAELHRVAFRLQGNRPFL